MLNKIRRRRYSYLSINYQLRMIFYRFFSLLLSSPIPPSHILLPLSIRPHIQYLLLHHPLNRRYPIQSLLLRLCRLLSRPSHLQLDHRPVYLLILHLLCVLLSSSLLDCRPVVDVLVGQDDVLTTDVVETCGLEEGPDVHCVVKETCERDEDQRVKDEVDLPLLLLFLPAMILLKLHRPIKIKILRLLLQLLRKHLPIILSPRIRLSQHIIRLFYQQKLFGIRGL